MRTRGEYKKMQRSVILKNKLRFPYNDDFLLDIEKEILKFLSANNLQSNYEVHNAIQKYSYATIRRTLENLFILGICGKRKIGSRTLYFISEETKEEKNKYYKILE